MIICSCNIITEEELRQEIFSLLEKDPWQIIVPNKLFHALGKKGKCGFCFPNVAEIIIKHTEAYHQIAATPDDLLIELRQKFNELHQKFERWLSVTRSVATQKTKDSNNE